MRVEDLRPIAAIEALDIGVLIGLAGLNVVNRDAVLRRPVDKGLRDKLGPIVPSEEEATAGQVLL